jgi:hypothetical protein
MMKKSQWIILFCIQIILGGIHANGQTAKQIVEKWKVHDPERPMPPVVNPGPAGEPVAAPSDAIILFDGKDLSEWTDGKGQPARWKIENSYMEVVAKTGAIWTKQKFGDCQLHVEWASPVVVKGESQGRGNSGVFLMNIYEVQILDCYNNKTYADGMTASLYAQYPPMVNACRPPGEWQTYDIIFRKPRFDDNGQLISPAWFTVFHNNILVHNNVELIGPTTHKARPPYKAHPDRLPISLQDHGNPVRFRNIWIRDLEK